MFSSPQTFSARISLDGSSVGRARTFLESATVLAFDPLTSTLIAWTGADLIRFDPAGPPTSISCILDAADLLPVSSVAPGELLSIFGPHFTSGRSLIGAVDGFYPTSFFGLTAAFNGLPGPLLYESPQQINVQVPYEIDGSSQVVLTLSSSSQIGFTDTRTLTVAPRNPVAFLKNADPLAYDCPLLGPSHDSYNSLGPFPLALNSDGSINSCANPAIAGSAVRIFLAGLGITDPASVTGSVNGPSGAPLNLPLTFDSTVGFTSPILVSAGAVPGSISGVWQLDIQTPADRHRALRLPAISVDSVPIRDRDLTIWVH